MEIRASVPVRICDNGGWTDTWFGGPGKVLNVAVEPGVTVTIRDAPGSEGVVVEERNALVTAAIDTLPAPPDRAVAIAVRSAVPAGCGAGTSAAVAVALVGALSALRSESRSPRQIAYAAHSLEVDVLGLESGIQDHLSAAFGAINYIEIDPYPHAIVQRLPEWEALGARLTLVALGRPHDSSRVHRDVIDHITHRDATAALDRLREAAVAARDAVLAQDFTAFGAAMSANTDAQRLLHPALVGASATAVITHAQETGAIGWKVNGAGGDGGSVTILHATPDARDAFSAGVAEPFRVLPARIAKAGLVVDYDTS